MASVSTTSEKDTYSQVLARRIQRDFETYVRPSSVLSFFHKYNEKILTRRDKQNVDAATTTKGDIDGSVVLLERLCGYDGWVECLLKVLRDPDVKLDHVAKTVEEKKARLDKEWREDESFSKLSTYSGGSESGFHLSRTTPRRSGEGKAGPMGQPQSMGNESYDQDDGYIQPSNCEYADARSMGANGHDDHDDGIDEDFEIISKPEFTEADAINGTATKSMIAPENEHAANARIPQELNVTGSDVTTSIVPESHHVLSSEGAAKTPEAEYQKQTRKVLNKKEKVIAKKHGSEYDFLKEDTATELSQCQGWHSVMTETKIWEKLNPLIGEDGHYILWYWEQRKRPALCVTNKKELKTLLVHKRPDKTDRSKASYYFLDKKQKKLTSLRELVEYHIEHGVRDMTKGKKSQTISFLHPVSEQ